MTIILVTGPEGSGNRMICRMLTEAGAETILAPMPKTTRNKAFPPGGNWTVFSNLVWDCAVVIHRDLGCTLKAQVAAMHVSTDTLALKQIRKALINIYAQLGVNNKPWFPVTYESLAQKGAILDLCNRLGLDGSQVRTKWQDANAKYYGGKRWSDNDPLWKKSVSPST